MKTQARITSNHPGLWQAPRRQSWHQHAGGCGLHTSEGLASELARIQQDPRWLLLINPPAGNWSAQLAQAGVDLVRVLQVRCDDDVAAQWALEQALTGNTCALVLAWIPSLDGRDWRRLELASRRAHCPALLFQGEQAHRIHNPVH